MQSYEIAEQNLSEQHIEPSATNFSAMINITGKTWDHFGMGYKMRQYSFMLKKLPEASQQLYIQDGLDSHLRLCHEFFCEKKKKKMP